jgi:hypothetical protein
VIEEQSYSSGTATTPTLPGMFEKKVTCTSSTMALVAKIAPPYKLYVARQELERRKFRKDLTNLELPTSNAVAVLLSNVLS